MIKKKNSKIIQFPTNLTEGERQIEAILFAIKKITKISWYAIIMVEALI